MTREREAAGGRTAMTPRPVARAERYEALDVLRGFAVLGIFAINIWHMGLPEAFLVNPLALGPLEGTDRVIWHAVTLLVMTKFYTLFSLLFGVGVAIVVARSGPQVHRRRMVFLLGVGLIHAYLIWPGDILVTYALCGLLATSMVGLGTRALWLSAGGLLVIGCVLVPVLLGGAEWGGDASAPELEREILLRQSASWFTQVRLNVVSALELQIAGLLLNTGWRTLGAMALGVALYRSGFLTARWSLRAYGLTALLGLGGGLGLDQIGIATDSALGQTDAALLAWYFGFNYWGSLIAALGYAALFNLLVCSGAFSRLRAALAATGRMAFTNYLTQSLIGTGLMYGTGLGLFGQLTLPALFGISLAVWGAQILASQLWLARFERGPLEALWRRFSYPG